MPPPPDQSIIGWLNESAETWTEEAVRSAKVIAYKKMLLALMIAARDVGHDLVADVRQVSAIRPDLTPPSLLAPPQTPPAVAPAPAGQGAPAAKDMDLRSVYDGDILTQR